MITVLVSSSSNVFTSNRDAIMSFRRRRQTYSNTVKRDALALLVPIVATCGMVFLLWFFGHTLWRAKEPLVTRLARRVHGTLPPEMEAYTRGVTFAWCVFFAAQIVISALLFEFASLSAWSLFISVLNFPLLVLMFAGEYAYRMTFHRNFPHASILEAIQSFSEDAARSRSAKGH